MSICILGFVFALRTTFVGVLLAPTVLRVVSALSSVPTFNRILVLVLALVLVLSVLSLLSLLSLLPFAFCPCRACLCFVCPCLCRMHQCPLSRLLLGVMNLSVSRFVQFRDLYTHSMFLFLLSRHRTKSISHGSTVRVSRDHLATKLQGNSCESLPQECVRFLGHLNDHSIVSRDLPPSRWRTSVQATLVAVATESPSRDFAPAFEAMVTSC